MLQELKPEDAAATAHCVVRALVKQDQQSNFDPADEKMRFHQALTHQREEESDDEPDETEITQELPVLPIEQSEPNALKLIDKFVASLFGNKKISIEEVISITKATDIFLDNKSLPESEVSRLDQIAADPDLTDVVLRQEIKYWENLPKDEYCKWQPKFFQNSRAFHPLFSPAGSHSPKVIKYVLLILRLVRKHIIDKK